MLLSNSIILHPKRHSDLNEIFKLTLESALMTFMI